MTVTDPEIHGFLDPELYTELSFTEAAKRIEAADRLADLAEAVRQADIVAEKRRALHKAENDLERAKQELSEAEADMTNRNTRLAIGGQLDELSDDERHHLLWAMPEDTREQFIPEDVRAQHRAADADRWHPSA